MRKNFVICLSLISAVILTTGCKGNKKEVKETEETPKVLVKTLTAVYQDIENSVEFTSNIQPYKENNIAPSMSVRIDKIFVDVGANVRKGQLLVKMDPTQYNQANVQLTNLKADYDRLKAVYDAGGISKQQLDQAETSMNVQLEQVNNLKENIELLSPIDGVITARNYDPGDMYSTNNPVLQVMQMSTLKVTVAVSEQYFPYVKMGMPADIRVDMYSDRTFPGKVTLIHPAINVATRTFEIEVSIPNPKSELRPGMFSRTKLNFGMTPGLMVEDIAVQKQIGSNDKYLYVANNGEAERRAVITGRQVGSKIEIVDGVREGDEVITAGISRLFNGTEIEVKND